MTGAGDAAFAVPAPRPTALNPSAPTVAAPTAIFVRNIAKTPFANPQRCATLGSLNSCPTVRDLVRSTTKRWITHPHPHCPNAAPTRRRPSPRRPPGLPRPRRRPTPRGRAAHAIRRCRGRRSTHTAALSRGLRRCGSQPSRRPDLRYRRGWDTGMRHSPSGGMCTPTTTP